MKNLFDDDKKADISYPSSWEYKIMIQDTSLLQKIVQNILKSRKYTSELSHKSKSGKYTSFNISLIVENEEERLMFFDDFKQHKDVSFVL